MNSVDPWLERPPYLATVKKNVIKKPLFKHALQLPFSACRYIEAEGAGALYKAGGVVIHPHLTHHHPFIPPPYVLHSLDLLL